MIKKLKDFYNIILAKKIQFLNKKISNKKIKELLSNRMIIRYKY